MKDVLNIRLQSKELIRAMEASADRLECDPRQLAVALLMVTFRADLVDGILDGDDPKGYAPHYAMQSPRGQLGPRQAAFMVWFRRRLAGRDEVEFSYKVAAKELGWDEGSVGTVARSLISRGDLLMVKAGARSHPSRWSLPALKSMEAA